MRESLESVAQTRGWNEYEMFVVNELKNLRSDVKEISGQLNKISVSNASMKTEISNLKRNVKVQGGKWGAVSGILGAIVIALLKWFGLKE